MNYVQCHSTRTLEIKQSKFIAHIVPFSLYEKTLLELKQEHPKARHFVTAYRYINEFKQVVEHSSDDGEPKGTSGKPTLMVLQGANLINTAIITVRYFGGTKLGTGGLVRAYSDATNLVIEGAQIKAYKENVLKTISFEYTHLRQIEYSCDTYGVEIIDKVFNTSTVYTIKADVKSMEDFLKKVDRLIYLP